MFHQTKVATIHKLPIIEDKEYKNIIKALSQQDKKCAFMVTSNLGVIKHYLIEEVPSSVMSNKIVQSGPFTSMILGR